MRDCGFWDIWGGRGESAGRIGADILGGSFGAAAVFGGSLAGKRRESSGNLRLYYSVYTGFKRHLCGNLAAIIRQFSADLMAFLGGDDRNFYGAIMGGGRKNLIMRFMGLAILHSRALTGVYAAAVTVEVHLSGGLPQFNIVGLPDTEVKEARERVRAAILNTGFAFPARRITINLAPADMPKEGGIYDLPIALGILAASGQMSADTLGEYEFAGELALDGGLRSCGSALPITLAAARESRAVIMPVKDAAIGALASGAVVYAADSLLSVCAHLGGRDELPQASPPPILPGNDSPCIGEVKGQAKAKWALEVAAAGGHSILMMGPPGCGKSMLATRLCGLMPLLTDTEALESAAVRSLSGGDFEAEKWRQRPFRSPHHTASAAALIGGGSKPRPGEISLSHHGVLFWTNYRSLTVMYWRYCGSRWNRER